MSTDDGAAPAANEEAKSSDHPGSHWRIWSCIVSLLKDVESNPMMAEPYRSTTRQVASILRQWGHNWAGDLAWASFLNKRTLHHEAEECIVALHHLRKWMKSSNTKNKEGKQRVLAVDVCGGKGFFSMLLSYMASEYWQSEGETCTLEKIILLEKATTDDIDWSHIQVANAREQKGHPLIEVWSDTNLHEYDNLLSRFQDLGKEHDSVLALTGIHLCKMLSPSFVNLVNGLACPYVLLAPCCLPRILLNAGSKKQQKKKKPSTIPIYLHETQQEQEQRLEHNRRKLIARNNHACSYCQKKKHWVKHCPELKHLSQAEKDELIKAAIQETPCWNCGTVGHFRSDCPTPQEKITTRFPPTVHMDVSNMIASSTPYEDYCNALAKFIQIDGTLCHPVSDGASRSEAEETPKQKKLKADSCSVQIIEAGLTGNKSGHDGNWNSRRKSIFLVATR